MVRFADGHLLSIARAKAAVRGCPCNMDVYSAVLLTS